MKRILVLNVMLLLLFAANGGERAHAQGSQRLSATPKAFQAFYAKFRKAVVARDKNTVASLTRFPFKYGFDAGDEGTYSKAQFLRKFDVLFGSDSRFFARANPTFHGDGGTFDLEDESDASHYIFEKRGAAYQFTSYIVEP